MVAAAIIAKTAMQIVSMAEIPRFEHIFWRIIFTAFAFIGSPACIVENSSRLIL